MPIAELPLDAEPKSAFGTGGGWWLGVLGTLCVGMLDYFAAPAIGSWQSILPRLHFLPIIYAAVRFGWRGGMGTALLASLMCFMPNVPAWRSQSSHSPGQYGDIVVFHLVGGVTGVLSDLERRRRRQLQRQALDLSKALVEVQNSAEQLKRAERLSTIGALSANLAEEVRTPLAVIEHSIEELGRPAVSEERRGMLFELTKRECRRIDRLLRNLSHDEAPPTTEPATAKSLLSVQDDTAAGRRGYAN